MRGSLEALRAALASGDWSHAVLITGQDYPIRPRGEIGARLAAAGERSFVQWTALPRRDSWQREREVLAAVRAA